MEVAVGEQDLPVRRFDSLPLDAEAVVGQTRGGSLIEVFLSGVVAVDRVGVAFGNAGVGSVLPGPPVAGNVIALRLVNADGSSAEKVGRKGRWVSACSSRPRIASRKALIGVNCATVASTADGCESAQRRVFARCPKDCGPLPGRVIGAVGRQRCIRAVDLRPAQSSSRKIPGLEFTPSRAGRAVDLRLRPGPSNAGDSSPRDWLAF
jgi:hypothetical protein